MNRSKILFALLVIFLAVYLAIFSFGKFHSNQNFHSENANSSESSHTNYLRWNLGVTPKEFAPLQRKFFDFMSRNQSCQAYSFVSYNDTADNSWPGDAYLMRYYNLVGDKQLADFYINCSLSIINSFQNKQRMNSSDFFFIIRFIEFYPELYNAGSLNKYPQLTSKEFLDYLTRITLNKSQDISVSSIYTPGFKADLARSLYSLYLITKNPILKDKSFEILENLSASQVPKDFLYSKAVVVKTWTFFCYETNNASICRKAEDYVDELISSQKDSGQLCLCDNVNESNPPLLTYQYLQALKYMYLSNYTNSSEKEKLKESALKALDFTLNFVDNENGGIVENVENPYFTRTHNPIKGVLPQKTISLNYEVTRVFYTFYNSSNSQ